MNGINPSNHQAEAEMNPMYHPLKPRYSSLRNNITVSTETLYTKCMSK